MKCLGNGADIIRPVGNGVNCGSSPGPAFKTIGRPRQPIIPYPTGRASRSRGSRHFMPGYHHAVPPGRIASGASSRHFMPGFMPSLRDNGTAILFGESTPSALCQLLFKTALQTLELLAP